MKLQLRLHLKKITLKKKKHKPKPVQSLARPDTISGESTNADLLIQTLEDIRQCFSDIVQRALKTGSTDSASSTSENKNRLK